MSAIRLLSYGLRIALLGVLFAAAFMGGAAVMTGVLPETVSEPGLLPDTTGFAVMLAADTLLIAALILTSRWSGWKLALALAVAYYGLVTLVTQVEAWYFLTDLTFGPELLPRLFIMGLPTAFVFIPVAVWVLGKGRSQPDTAPNPALRMPAGQWVWKLAVIAAAYLMLYWGAGYFIAWQNPDVRAFYGQPGDIAPIWAHTAATLRADPLLLPLQIVRAMLWMGFALPVIRGSKVSAGWTALLVGLLMSVPQNIGHILANPLLPVASVRLSHLIETASSTFVFGLIVVWLLHREHHSVRDLFGLKATEDRRPQAIQGRPA